MAKNEDKQERCNYKNNFLYKKNFTCVILETGEDWGQGEKHVYAKNKHVGVNVYVFMGVADGWADKELELINLWWFAVCFYIVTERLLLCFVVVDDSAAVNLIG